MSSKQLLTPAGFAATALSAGDVITNGNKGEGFVVVRSTNRDSITEGTLVRSFVHFARHLNDETNTGALLRSWEELLNALLADGEHAKPAVFTLVGAISTGVDWDCLLLGKTEKHGIIAIGMGNLLTVCTRMGYPVTSGFQFTTEGLAALIRVVRTVAGETSEKLTIVFPVSSRTSSTVRESLGCDPLTQEAFLCGKSDFQSFTVPSIRPADAK